MHTIPRNATALNGIPHTANFEGFAIVRIFGTSIGLFVKKIGRKHKIFVKKIGNTSIYIIKKQYFCSIHK